MSVVFGFLFVKREPPSTPGLSFFLKTNRDGPFFALRAASAAGEERGGERGHGGRGGAGTAAMEGAGPRGAAPLPARRPRGLSWAARRTKRLPLPPPRPRSKREGEGGQEGLEEEEGEGEDEEEEGRCCRRDWAGSRRPGRGERRGWAPSENWEEGRILEAQDKQIVPLHVRGEGRWGASAAASPPLPLADSLSPSAGPSARRKPVAALASPPAPGTHRPGTCAISKPHDGRAAPAGLCAADRGAVCTGNGRRCAAPARSRIPVARPTQHPGGAVGEGAQTPFPSFRPPLTQKGKQKNRRREIRERILASGLGGGNCPFLLEKLSHWLLILPRTRPPSHLSLFYLPATFHCSGLIRQAPKVGGQWGGGSQAEDSVQASLKGKKERIPSEVVWRGLLAQTLGVAFPSRPLQAAPLLTLPAAPPAGLAPSLQQPAERTRAPHPRALPRAPPRATTLACFSPTSKFIHKTLRLSQPKVGELGRGGERLSFPASP